MTTSPTKREHKGFFFSSFPCTIISYKMSEGGYSAQTGLILSHIFISYSRKDLDFAQKIVDALAANNLDTWIDWKSIPKGEDWEQEIYRGIEETDAFLFLISPDSVASQMCNKEIVHAIKNGKRILPIVIRDADHKIIHPEISKRNWIFCRDGQDDFNKAIEETRKTIDIDYDWLKFHTELQVKALKWEQKKDASRLIRGKELREAEKQLAEVSSQEDPQPTKLQREYILASRRGEERQRRQITMGLGFGFVIMTALSVFAWLQRNEAQYQSKLALARQLAAQAQSVFEEYPQRSILLAIEAIKTTYDTRNRPVPIAESVLRWDLSKAGGRVIKSSINISTKISISPNGKWLAAGSSDNSVYIWDTTNFSEEPIRLFGQKGGITFVAFSDDNHWLVSGSEDGTARIWNMNKITDESVLLFHSNAFWVDVGVFSHDNHWLVTGDIHGVHVWDLTDLSLPPVNIDVNGGVYSLGISHDNSWLAAGCGDHTVRVWRLNDFKSEPKILYGHKGGVWTLDFSPDSHWLVTGGGAIVSNRPVPPDTTAIVWDLTNLSSDPIILYGHEGPINDVKFSKNGRWLVTASSDGTAQLWDLSQPEYAKKSIVLRGHENGITGSQITSDSRLLITSSLDGTIRLWDLSSENPDSKPLILRGHEGGISAVSISPNGDSLFTSSEDKTIRVWNLENPFVDPHIFSTGIGSHIRIFEHWFFQQKSDYILNVWDLNNLSSKPLRLYGSQDYINSLSTDGHWLIASSQETARLWNLDDPNSSPVAFEGVNDIGINFDGRWLARRNPSETSILVSNLADPLSSPLEFENGCDFQFSPHGRWLRIINLDGSAQIIDLMNISLETAIVLDNTNKCLVSKFDYSFSNDDHWLAKNIENGNEIILWDLLSNRVYYLPFDNSKIDRLSFSPDSRWLFAGGYQTGPLFIWDLSEISGQPYVTGKISQPYMYRTSSDSHWLFTVEGENSVFVRDLTNLSSSPIILTNVNQVDSLATSLNGKWLAIEGVSLDTVYAWKFTQLNSSPRIFRGHEGPISVVSISNNDLLITGGMDKTVRIWDLNASFDDPVILSGHEGDVHELYVSNDNEWLLTVSLYDDTARLWTLNIDELVVLACETAGRNLTQVEWAQFFPGESYRTTCPQWPAGE